MKPTLILMFLLWSPVTSLTALADKSNPTAADPVQAAFDKLVQAVTNTDWHSEAEARKELSSLGGKVVPKLIEAARSHAESRVRRVCYEILTGPFAKDDRAIDTVIQFGLKDKEAGIRYSCAFLLGDLKVGRAATALRSAFDGTTGKDDEFLHYTLAKSLAQLGQADVLPTLFNAVSDDSSMVRYIGNIGLKALSDKNLEDFEEYHSIEGQWIIGGYEFATYVEPITLAERKAQRFQAAIAYFKWLKAERPELYKYVTYDHIYGELRGRRAAAFKRQPKAAGHMLSAEEHRRLPVPR
jgi:HEAT repeat protein